MRLVELVQASARIGETARRLAKIDTIAGLLRQLRPEEVEVVVAFLSGSARQGRIGIGFRTLQEAAGSAAAEPVLEVLDVDAALEEIGATQGRGSADRRAERLRRLFRSATAIEQDFLARLLSGELRQGALEGLMMEAVAKASGVPLETVRRSAMLAGDIKPVARAALQHGAGGLQRFSVQLFRPVQMMLAQSAADIGEALGDLGEASIEYKLDGARVQVHRSGDDVAVFSRSLNDVTAAVPEVVEAVRALPAKQFILDGEVVSLRPDGRPEPFQTTMRRFGRRLKVEEMRAALPLTPFWFDLLHLDGADLLDQPQFRRFSSLAALAPGGVIPHLLTGEAERAEEFLRSALDHGHEGVMAKALNAAYAAGARAQSWLKIKKAHTLDLVVLAAEWGHGRRRGTLSNLHLGARDEKGAFVMLGKTFKGLTDGMLAWQTRKLLELEVARDEYTVYVRPELVVEIAFSDLQVSPRYPGGLALRFARVKRYRTDKTAAEADDFRAVQRLAGAAA